VTTTMKTRKTTPRTLNYLPSAGLLFLAEGKTTTAYFLANTKEETHCEQPTFRLEKATDGTVYNVLLHGEHSLCDCQGFEHHGMNTRDGKGCKHVAALAKLQQLGKL
jgi:hypothetical protein